MSLKEQNYLQECENLAKKPRFGLFSHPLGIQFNEDSYSRKKEIKPQKKRLEISKNKTGNYGQALFQNPQFITIGDHYQDSYRPRQLEDKARVDLIPHSKPFRNTDSRKTTKTAPYAYMPSEKPKEYHTRDEDGHVKTAPRKIYTNSSKKGNGSSRKGHLFSQYEYVSDPYDRLRQQDVKEQIEHRKKFLSTKPFKNNSTSIKFFDKERITYGSTHQGHSTPQPARPASSIHAHPFKPAFPPRQGYQKTFSHNDYIEENCFKQKQNKKKLSIATPWKHNQLHSSSFPHSDMKTIPTTDLAALRP